MSSDAVNALKRAKIFNAFHHRYYTTFLVSSSLMGFETLMFYLVLSWHVLELTNSPFLLMVVTASKYVATLLFGGVAGVITDRVGNRNVIIAIQMTNMVLMFMMAILIQTGMIQYWHIIVIVALWGIGGLAFGGAKQAIIHDIVGKRDLTNAMGFQMIIHTPISAFGSVVGGALIGLIGYSSCYYFLGATCGAAALLCPRYGWRRL